jgi:hypothetical protein
MITNYDNLTIKQFLNCKLIADLETDPIQRKVKMLAEISGKSVDEVESMPIEKMISQLKQLEQIENISSVGKVKMKFKVDGKRFECIWKPQELTTAQYVDVTHFCKDQDAIVSNIHNILAAICVEVKWFKRTKYDGVNHKDISNLFLNKMKISQAYPIMVFFCKFYQELSNNILICLEKEVQEVKELAEKHLKAGGDGLQSLTT